MLDINRIRENPEAVKEALKKKLWDADFTELLAWDKRKKELIQFVEGNKAEMNKLSASVPQAKKNGEDVSKIFAKVKEIAAANAESDKELKELEEKIFNFLAELPNIPDDDLLGGGKENNKPIRSFGKKPEFDFPMKDHVELATSLGLVDYDRAAKIAGRGAWIYTNLGAQLEWALLNYFITTHLKDGYTFILPPHLLNEASGFGAGQFPKFREDVFWLNDMEPKRFLLPTAETALVNIYRDEIMKEEDLPKKLFAYTPCYRREAGSYRTEERGMIRGYQFDKVEMVQYTKPEDSDAAFEELVRKAEALVAGLGLHYQVSKLAAGDISHSMARTYDIGLATSRIFPAILEQFQQADGSVIIPEVLRPWMGGLEVLKPIKK